MGLWLGLRGFTRLGPGCSDERHDGCDGIHRLRRCAAVCMDDTGIITWCVLLSYYRRSDTKAITKVQAARVASNGRCCYCRTVALVCRVYSSVVVFFPRRSQRGKDNYKSVSAVFSQPHKKKNSAVGGFHRDPRVCFGLPVIHVGYRAPGTLGLLVGAWGPFNPFPTPKPLQSNSSCFVHVSGLRC